MSSIALSGNAAGAGVFTVAAPNSASSYTATLPTATTTLVGTDATQTLTNKTLTSPTLTTPNIDSASVPSVSGTAPLYMARAWCLFNGATTGTNAPTAGGNVSTITRNSAGNYTINFTTAMPNANYATVISGVNTGQTENFGVSAQTTTSVTIINGRSGVGPTDTSAFTAVAIYR